MNDVFKSVEEIKDYLDLMDIEDSMYKANYIFSRYSSIHRLNLLGVLDDILAGESKKFRERTIKSVSTLLYSDDISSELLDMVEITRLMIFGQKEAPFKTHHEAYDWIKELESDYWLEEETVKKRDLFNTKFYELYDKAVIGELVGTATRNYKTIPFYKEDKNDYEEQSGVYYEHSWHLKKLQYKSELISKMFNFSQSEILKLILLNEKPELVRYDIKKHEGKRESLVVTFNTSDITLEEIKQIYDIYKRELKVKKKKKFSEKQERLLNLVNELKPKIQNKSFSDTYSAILNEWNSRYPEDAYSTYQGIYKAHEGLKKKLNEI